jgi:hypothetical protein
VDLDTCWKYNTVYNSIKIVVPKNKTLETFFKTFVQIFKTFPNFFQTLWKFPESLKKSLKKKLVVSPDTAPAPTAP